MLTDCAIATTRSVQRVVRRRVLVSGRVQGVWFRETCRREANALGVAGSVRNRWDGRVEAVFEGEPSAVQAMVTWCRLGPPRAGVTDVDVTDEPPEGDVGFRVLP
jgi:acylphosphatase